MLQRYVALVPAVITLNLFVAVAQSGGPIYSKNVAVIGQDKFGNPGGSSDVWGFRKAGSPDKHYALSTITGGLSIALVNSTSPIYYNSVAYVNHDSYPNDTTTLNIEDVETFEVNSTVYAALAVPLSQATVVYIINIDSAISLGLSAQNRFVPISSVQTTTISRFSSGAQAHTITIANNLLYIATQTRYIDIWDVSNPYAPNHKGAYALPSPVPGTSQTSESVHEMYVDPNGPNGPRAYVAYTRGGLFIVDIDTSNVTNSVVVTRQMYDSDKSSVASEQSLALDIDQYSVFTWTNPVGSDPLLRKSGSHVTVLARRRASDERYSSAFDAAMDHKLLGRYTMAVEKFADALAFVGSRWEAEQCLLN